MNDFQFGLTMIIVGMGGTLVVLSVLAFCMSLLKKIFPNQEENV